MTTKTNRTLVDTNYHSRRLAARLKDPEFRAEYERARAEIAQIDAVMHSLDHLREEAGFSKAELARQIGKADIPADKIGDDVTSSLKLISRRWWGR